MGVNSPDGSWAYAIEGVDDAGNDAEDVLEALELEEEEDDS